MEERTERRAGPLTGVAELRDRVAEVAVAHELVLVVLFGSRATGLATAESDADLAVRSARCVLDPLELIDLQTDFERVLPGPKADLVDLARADPLLLHRVFADGAPLYDVDGAFERERLRAFHRYEDYRPTCTWSAGPSVGRLDSMSVDPELVRRKAHLILEDLALLEPLGRMDFDEYRADSTKVLALERLLERIIGRMIDTNYHLAVGLRGLPPKDYHESFIGLARLGILSHMEAAELAQVAGLRNRLAHEYNGIDNALVHACARRCLADVPAYLRAIEAFLERPKAV